ncbi:hypothetical protein C9J21_17140 [Photobacterium phosphoreum]|uniref:phage integrase N-terminal SAM-like domain-containing protein n=1 Tax=Photobacterium phosphoreum TaxID=659 RepID=UPI000D152000|nr:hypothetical protein C9J21_17140 [Photobacterium phosphoreum]
MNNEQQQRSDYLYEQHVTHLTLQGKRPATIDGYSRALRRITHHLDKSPDTLTTDDLKRYFAQLIKTHSWSTVRIDRNELRKLWVSYVSIHISVTAENSTDYYPSSRKRSMSYP